jgi:RNA polymerase sigma-70 factor (ECF subfamily)
MDPHDGQDAPTAADALIAAAQAGAPWAWQRLYADLAPAVAGYARAHGVRDVDDLCGDVWLSITRGIGSFHGSAAGFRSWVFVIVHRRVLDDHRRHRRRPEASEQETGLDAAGAPAPAADDDVLQRLAHERVMSVLDRLVPDQRDVLVLRIVADLTVAEVATVLGKTEGAVKALQRRGFGAVRKIFSDVGVPL